MASNASDSIAEEFVEDRLFSGLFTGSLLQHKELLDMVDDVNVRGVRQKTLLHVGVRLGKADWVEELLARGADTDLVDDTQLNALSSAEEMVHRFPEDTERSEVLKLVSLVHRRDQVILRCLESSSSKSTGLVTPVASPECDIASLKSSVDAMRQEMKSLLCQLSSSLEELKAKVCGRDILLRCLEEAVTSTVEDVTSIKFRLGGDIAVNPSPSNAARARQECVDAMMCRTTIVYRYGADIMRSFYERLYDEDCYTAYIITCLCRDDRVKVMVDPDSIHIGRMKDNVMALDGTQLSGFQCLSFGDLQSEIVYLGAKVCSDNSEKDICGRLALTLAQLSLKLVFDNEGWPYKKGDVISEWDWMMALEELEEEGRKRVWGLHRKIQYALDRRTQLAKVCYLAATVPQIITLHGSTAGRSILQQQAPRLLSLYCDHVIPKLQAKVRVSPISETTSDTSFYCMPS
ncbi:uncharacterized protein LOC124172328 isoform X1 [Ischnura elegans]|uniref:uncharacterized protein LOC124172328 isoform X1 n=1 Tax=Ischnura elegans TaxID=197161 RepID=UPI001ED8B75B|nr:uncharacterized protein LOC124172328 isoform X1 [Ischnura elegans]XP_046407726.1 uncharacterized protein LOC124172328 isoform X1 [Ischnura elegans]XP_046407727.1 uncharacterized protein LOC124172328 isoform X1 [Ischnura elegans]